MGWIPNGKGGEQYSYTLTGQNSNHTLPNANGSESVPSCIVVVRQPAYKAYNVDKKEVSLGGWSEVYHSTTVWKVLSCRTQLVRYYAASSAKITLSTTINNKESRIAPPGLTYDTSVPKYNANNYSITDDNDTTHEIRPEMQIEIWMGFLSRFETPGKYINSANQVNPRKYTKVFMGVIDTVDLKLGRGETSADGISCTITARDYMRYLIDNKYFGGLSMPGYDFSSTSGVDRGAIVKALIEQGSAGGVGSEDVPGRLYFHPSGRTPMKMSTLWSKLKGGTTDTTPAILNGTVPFALVDQFPVDAIRWFSSIETMPRELYCNVNTGRIAWTVRMLGEPYKLDNNSELFKSVYGTVVASNYNDLYKSIVSSYSGWPDEVAKEIATFILDKFKGVFESYPYMDVITYMAMIGAESSWNPQSKGREFLKKGKWRNVCGLGQINLAQDGTTDIAGSLHKQSDHVLAPTSANLDLLKKHIELTLIILREKQSTIRSSIPWFDDPSFFADNDAHQIAIYQAYNGGINEVIDSLKKAKAKGTITTSSFLANISTSIGVEDGFKAYWSKIIENRNLPQWKKYYLGVIKKVTSTEVANLSGNGNVGVLRGLDDPWVLSYKRTVVSTSSKTIKPNVLSAHASWSTLGILTRFTLINPVIDSAGAGIGNLRGTHSLWASNGAAPSVGMLYNDAIRTTADVTGTGSSAASLAAGVVDKTRLESTQEITPAGYKTKYTTGSSPILNQATLTQPYKFVSKIRFPVRNRYMWDESSDASVTDTAVDLILNAMMHVHSQDIHALDFVVPLNPDMRPSHVVEAHNMGFFDGEKLRIEGIIHMFASGGVQNGCTTMGVAVSTQASHDPRRLAEYLKNILEIQGGTLAIPTTFASAGIDPKGTRYSAIAPSFDFRNVRAPSTTDLYDYDILRGINVKIRQLQQLVGDTYNNISSAVGALDSLQKILESLREAILTFLNRVYLYFFNFIFWTEWSSGKNWDIDTSVPLGIYGPALGIDLETAEQDVLRTYKKIITVAKDFKTAGAMTDEVGFTHLEGDRKTQVANNLEILIRKNPDSLISTIQSDSDSLNVLGEIYNSVNHIIAAKSIFKDTSTGKTYKVLVAPITYDFKNSLAKFKLKIKKFIVPDFYSLPYVGLNKSISDSDVVDKKLSDIKLFIREIIDEKILSPALPFLEKFPTTVVATSTTLPKIYLDSYIIGLAFLEELNELRNSFGKTSTNNINKLIDSTFEALQSYEEQITKDYDDLVKVSSGPASSPVPRARPR